MLDSNTYPKSFIEEAEALILENVEDESFGVSELAEAMHMSRSSLLRKIKKSTELSASQFIRQIRLKRGIELLKDSSLSVSEVSYKCGFASVSYFIKCFREEYGHPPGEFGKIPASETAQAESSEIIKSSNSLTWKLLLVASVVLVTCLIFYFNSGHHSNAVELEKSIAVLPFKNESSDSNNVYFVNGLMESTLSNLQKINDLKVVSRTTSEKYRNSHLSIPEIAEELEVSYLVEGSGQKVGDQVMLNIQLIEAGTDRPIWSEQYQREITDIFDLQNEVAKEITVAIKAMVTPQELEIIQKRPTDNLEAYDYYLQALDPYYSRTPTGLNKAIGLFRKATEKDNEFALAYANIAISYYFLDMFQDKKLHSEKINSYSDQALLYDPVSDVSLTAKSLFYIENREFHLALPNLEKALEYNPNSALACRMLANFYAFYEPNTEKYLHYSLMDSQLDLKGQDSSSASYSYLGMSNALLQAGFFDQALKYVNLSLHFDSNNYYAPHLKIFVRFAKDQNYFRTQQLLTELWKKDTARIDILNDLAKMYYSQEKYDSAYYYYDKLVRMRDAQNINRYLEENIKIAKVYQEVGLEERASGLFEVYKANVEQDQSAYKSAGTAFQHAYLGEVEEGIAQLKEFSKKRNIQFWFLFMENDPLLKPLKEHPEFKGVMQSIKDGFWEDHKKLRNKLEEKDLL